VAIVGLMITAIVSTREIGPLPAAEPGPGRVLTSTDADANIKDLAQNLFSTHVFSFEFTSVLLVVAVAGTVVLTRRQRRPREGQSS
jgi:NADH-quinone oxidoreductase subunit J